MVDFNIILSAFNLSNVRVLQYSAGRVLLSNEIRPNKFNYTSGKQDLNIPSFSYSPQSAITVNHLHGGSQDSNLVSTLGTPVFADLRFQTDSRELQLQTVLIDVSQTKNIITTSVQGRNGTIKEYISDGDYVINIKGILASSSNAYPSSDVRDLLTILKKPEVLEIVSDYLRLFDIYQIVVTDYKFSQIEGYQNLQPFEINAISDTPDYLIQKL